MWIEYSGLLNETLTFILSASIASSSILFLCSEVKENMFVWIFHHIHVLVPMNQVAYDVIKTCFKNEIDT